MEPLVGRLPIVGGLHLTMVAPPQIDWVFSGLGQIAQFPGILPALKRVVNDLISDAVVLPNRAFVTWLRDSDIEISSMQYPMPQALLRIGIVEARKLQGKDWSLMSGKKTSDPYAKCQIGATKHETDVIYKTLEPKWKDDSGWHDYPMYTLRQPISLEIFDEDALFFTHRRDDSLGVLKKYNEEEEKYDNVTLDDLYVERDFWWKIYENKSKDRGQEAWEHVGDVHIVMVPYDLSCKRDDVGLIAKPPASRGKANTSAVLTIRLRGLRGLKPEKAKEAILTCIIEGKRVSSKPSTYKEEVIEESIVDPSVQRMVEYMFAKGKEQGRRSREIAEEINHVAGISEELVFRIVNNKPSFQTRWDQNIHLTLASPESANLQIELKLNGDSDSVPAFKLKEAISLNDKVIETQETNNAPSSASEQMIYEEVLQLYRGGRGDLGGRELDVTILLSALVEEKTGDC